MERSRRSRDRRRARHAIFPRLPGIAPYEAAKENGTVALLSSSEIRIFNRLTHHVHILEMNGDSYRLKQSRPKRGS